MRFILPPSEIFCGHKVRYNSLKFTCNHEDFNASLSACSNGRGRIVSGRIHDCCNAQKTQIFSGKIFRIGVEFRIWFSDKFRVTKANHTSTYKKAKKNKRVKKLEVESYKFSLISSPKKPLKALKISFF